MAARDEIISVRLGNAEYKEASKIAKADDRKLSAWVRKLVIAEIERKKRES